MTVKELNATLERERKLVAKGKLITGDFGIEACKAEINWQKKTYNKSLNKIYGELVVRGLNERFFNTLMIIACEQMMEVQDA